ncbi:MAG: hypothetical protein F6K54_10775 [Okeania sp. SIO3B5]|uniref:protein phosphatase 2C domain-containing protein n=1 Tax=Okeania sp. SIO3B5 TaxID=2607811 RepID=UPI0014001424|nr:protein phosphatase 2C domain-containing protein [Okeania sp. SIO3B5]NEO53525.1 hypothetical protein [Okeania sp. SIO3B5]
MDKDKILVISLDNKSGKSEDFQIAESYDEATVIGVFDGLGGRILGTAEETGGRIASRKAAEITQDILAESQGNLDKEQALKIKDKSCKKLKEFAENNLPVSRIKGKLASKRLCSTIAIASLFKELTDNQKYLVKIAWMGDSRIYYLHPHQGLQQLTKDDLKESKDALEVIYQDPPMSQFLTADPEADWKINYEKFEFSEEGFVLACTDGCFQYLPAPWEFEKLLLKTLIESNSNEEWQSSLTNFYQDNKHDDITLLVCSLGKNELDFQNFHSAYQSRLEHLDKNYNIQSESSRDELKQMWEQYRKGYENQPEKIKVKDSVDDEEVKNNDLSGAKKKTESKQTIDEKSSNVSMKDEGENQENSQKKGLPRIMEVIDQNEDSKKLTNNN